MRDGASPLYINPQFATESVPNHWSIVTGANVETHGLVADNFYDPIYKEHFNKDKTDLKWWNSTEPIWSQAQKQHLRTAVFDWPGNKVRFSPLLADSNSSRPMGIVKNCRFRQISDSGLLVFY